jgi:hypothetical protein
MVARPQAAAPAKQKSVRQNADGTGCPLKRKLGTFRHGGQLAVEYQVFCDLLQLDLAEAQNQRCFPIYCRLD